MRLGSSSPSPLATLLLLTSRATLSRAGNMAAWFTDLGPQVILQNDTTGAIHYTTCNAKGRPTYSSDNVFKFTKNPPKNNTGLTAKGYYDEKKTVASLFYLDQDNYVVNALFNCNMTTGLFNQAEGSPWIISLNAPLPVSPNSGLASVLLGPEAGYRVYYHDENMAINELAYRPGEHWDHKALISQDPQGSSAIASAFTGNENITVVTARDAENIEVTRYHADTNWRISTFPHPLEGNPTTQETSAENIKINESIEANFTLPSWNGKPNSLGISIDTKYTRSVWYIGEDKNLYQIANKNWTWSHQNSQLGDIWPVADSPNANLAVATKLDRSENRIYYLVNGSIAELTNDGGDWEKWTVLPPPEPVKIEAPPAPSPTKDPNPPANEGENTGGLTTAAKIGLGVGVALAVLATGLIATACFVLRRKQNVPVPTNSFDSGTEGQNYQPIGSSAGSSSFPSPGHSSYGSHGAVPGYGTYDQYAWEKQQAAGGGVPPAKTAGIYQAGSNGIYQADSMGIYQLDDNGKPAELASPRQVFELADQSHVHELMGSEQHHQHIPRRPVGDATEKKADKQ